MMVRIYYYEEEECQDYYYYFYYYWKIGPSVQRSVCAEEETVSNGGGVEVK